MKRLLLIASFLTVGSFIGAPLVAAQADAPATSWYVCKYVGPPGSGTETLQTGQNPIFVNGNAIETDPNVAVGDEFADAQGHSVVIAGPYAPPGLDPEPVCPTSGTTSTPPPPCEDENGRPLEECETTTTPPPTTTTPPPPTLCNFSVTAGPWYGDPRINIHLTGPGTFVVKGGIQRFSGLHKVTVTLDCNETFTVSRYKVHGGNTVSVFRNGVLVASWTAPILN